MSKWAVLSGLLPHLATLLHVSILVHLQLALRYDHDPIILEGMLWRTAGKRYVHSAFLAVGNADKVGMYRLQLEAATYGNLFAVASIAEATAVDLVQNKL